MPPEQERTDVRSPFMKMVDIFRSMPESTDPMNRNNRSQKLNYGGAVGVERDHSFPGSDLIVGYRVNVEPPLSNPPKRECEGYKEKDKGLYFYVGMDGLEALTFSHFKIKLFDANALKISLKIDLAHVTEEYRIEDIGYEKRAMAIAFVNWLDKVMQNNRYSMPPISASFFR